MGSDSDLVDKWGRKSPFGDSCRDACVRVWGMRSGIAVEVTAADRDRLHAIVANRNSPHKHVWRAAIVLADSRRSRPKVLAWLTRHPRVTFHFTPTSASWLNAVEGFFATLSKRRLRRGVFRGVVDLQAAINRYLADHNLDPKPFRWRANPDQIIAAAARGHQTLDSIH